MYIWSPLPRSLNATFRDIENPKPRVRISALADLTRWAGGEDRTRCIAQLVEVFRADADLEVRAEAAIALADAGAREALGALTEVADRGPPRLRQMALVAIGELATREDEPALRVVEAALESDAPALKFQALVAASHLFAPARLFSHVLLGLADAEPKVRYVACRIAEERFFDAADAVQAGLAELHERLTHLLVDPDPAVVIAAALPLARRGSTRACDLLVAALNRRAGFSQAEDEQAAIELCGELGLVAARPGLYTRAFGGWFGAASPLAFQARVALAKSGDERARALILRGLSSSSRSVRAQSVAAVGQARIEAARPRLLEMGRDETQADPHSVAEALAALDQHFRPQPSR